MKQHLNLTKEIAELQKYQMADAERTFLDYPWQNEQFYANWVSQSYYFLCHATRLLCHAGAYFDVKRNEALHLRCIEHSRQESRHEKLALNDLEALGYRIEDYPELPSTAQLYQSQYYLISFENPAAIFGSVLYLEGLSLGVGQTIYNLAKIQFGERAVSFLSTHVNEDISHMEQALAAVNLLTDPQKMAVLWSLKQNHALYGFMLREIFANFKQIKNRISA